jgi:hypothetical protein
MHSLGLLDEERSVRVVICADDVMVKGSVGPLHLVAVRRQPGVKDTENHDQPGGRRRTKGAGTHICDGSRAGRHGQVAAGVRAERHFTTVGALPAQRCV